MFARSRDWITLLPLCKILLPSNFNSVDFYSSMSLLVLDIDRTEKTILKNWDFKLMVLYKDFHFVRQRFSNLIDRQRGAQVIYMELRGVVERLFMRSCLLSFTT